MAYLSYVLNGCVDNLHICRRIGKTIARTTALKKAYFTLSAMVVTDSPGTRQMIATALQGHRYCSMWIVIDWICQDWSKWNYWIHASQSLHQNAFQTSSMCSYILVPLISMYKPTYHEQLHTMNFNNMTILTYCWIGPFMSWYSLSPQPSMLSIDFTVKRFSIKTNWMLNHYNFLIYFLSIVLEDTMGFCSWMWQ